MVRLGPWRLTERQRRMLANPEGFIAKELARQAREEKEREERRSFFPDTTRCYQYDGIGFHRHFLDGPDYVRPQGVKIYGNYFDCGQAVRKTDWHNVSDAGLKALGHLTRVEQIRKTYESMMSPEHEEWVSQVRLKNQERAKRSGKPWGWWLGATSPAEASLTTDQETEAEVEHSNGHEAEATKAAEASPTTDQETEGTWTPPTS